MDYKNYIKNGKLILPEGFNSRLNCSYNNLTKLVLPEGFNSYLDCYGNNLTELILPDGFNSDLNCDKEVRVYKWNEWLTLERFDMYLLKAFSLKELKRVYTPIRIAK